MIIEVVPAASSVLDPTCNMSSLLRDERLHYSTTKCDLVMGIIFTVGKVWKKTFISLFSNSWSDCSV